jgi:hypothetical protein
VKTGCSTGLSEYKKFKPENMVSKLVKGSFFLLALMTVSYTIMAQNSVPMGIHYQAVARNSAGNELANTKISVRFSVISDDPLSTPVFQEVHQNVITSRFGVFSLVIGHGLPTGNFKSKSLSEIEWDQANHYLKVEVQFENDYMDMGTMPFLAVPYALYAQKSLEPGPAGPKGDPGEKGEPGDPATDNQSLSFDGSNLSISGAVSTVNLTPLLQTLVVSNDGTGGYNLSLTRGNTINLATIEKDGDPKNEIQDLSISSNKLKITNNSNATEWDLTGYLDNTDGQALSWDPINRVLGISGNSRTISLRELESDADSSITNEIQDLSYNSATRELTLLKSSQPAINLTELKNDADADPTNELQSLTYDKVSGNLAISSKGNVNLRNTIGFKAKKSTSQTGLTIGTTYPFINTEAEFIEGDCYNISSGNFTAKSSGIYTFFITYKADGSGSSRILTLLKNDIEYEVLGPDISSGTELIKWVTMKLNQGDIIRLTIYTGMSTFSGTGSFLGYWVN